MIILSKLADYGVIIATHLAANPERQMTAAVLAHETNLPRATVAKVLKALAHAGIVAGARGAAGGYRLARDGAAISLAAVVAAIDGAMGVTQCTVHGPDCKRVHFCATRPHWRRINDAVSAALSTVTLAEMAMPFGVPLARPVAPREDNVSL
ncbi:MAG TPA: SUF system Fe-S cluster assembly regulator [Stellaceae bacterium]|jgi:FeS assembly SUF system regulator|nr:SUF system Fe-S cluster assembly regulator [Stellaceae bacterium]